MTDYLDVADLLVIADRIAGGTAVVRDVGLLTGAAGRPVTTWNGVEIYPTLDDKAAALLLSLVTDHALIDGNKRLGWVAVNVFYGLNASRLRVPEDDAYDVVLAIAKGVVTDVPDVAAILGTWREVPGT
ncbi:type II toxin-antitoxin system death-on-curing family toxin [Cellulomonas sp. KRMCY2]|uniref:type II toxin-antitoxin system death-on-curing family toxin n=1 Tax=Cellulomonas sp. KRMCY2 TaxID=1304865 RepID=UPI00045E7BC1|nr:Fic family protein [Cellulomonas sp. KRMCY2]